MSLFQQQREQVKKTILATSIAIFKEKGYENATIDEITKAVGIAKGTFYNFYSSKREILLLWAEQKFQQIPVQSLLDKDKTVEENLCKFIEILVKAIGNEYKLFQSFLMEILKVQGDSTYKTKFDFITIYSLILKNSRDSERIGESLLAEKIHVLNSSLFMGIINWFRDMDSMEGLQQYLIKIINICLYGLLK